jgi:tetratricopeptide (TPR) repeat protein
MCLSYSDAVIGRLREVARRWFRPARGPGDAETPATLAMAHYRAGVASYQARRFRKAVREFSLAIALAPGHAGMYQHRGAALAELGRLAQAINDYDRAVHLNPTFSDTYLDRGNAYHALGDRERAIRDYEEAIRLRPAFAEAHANRAAVLIETGQTEAAEAAATLARELKVDPVALDALLRAARTSRDRRTRRAKRSRGPESGRPDTHG